MQKSHLTLTYKSLSVKCFIRFNATKHSYTIQCKISKPCAAYYESFLFAKLQNTQHFIASFEMLYREDSDKAQCLQKAMLYSTFRDIQSKIASHLTTLH